MEEMQLEEIAACLRRDRTVFYYFKDRYAFQILEHVVGDGTTMSALKGSRYARLLAKPRVRQALRRTGSNFVRPLDLQAYWPSDTRGYRLSLGRWPLVGDKWEHDWHQTTRKGHNLVVQLNFAFSHNRALRRIVGLNERLPRSYGHPVAEEPEVTLGWARVDLDLDAGEALIEEVQSDWIRWAPRCTEDWNEEERRTAWRRYVRRVLKPYFRVWDEAILAAALWVVRSQIGLRRVFFHTHETGRRLKRLGSSYPPRSLYTALPRRFCFEETRCGPAFLTATRNRPLRRRLVDPATRWFVLSL